ncbi:MAG: tetraacyldisaccharide 4'-kinase [Flavobacteriaceae bacterium]|nr:tetraacyldisaccharide 4'-kinase [Flavobacteriaceae bacterium]
MRAIRFLLFPFAVLYDLITTIRNYFYDRGVFKSTSFDIPVIAVGNLSVGGTGKTPQIEYLIRLLQKGEKVAVLSRGYKRKTEGFVLINQSHTAVDVGDEPLQFFKKFPTISVAVDANRVNGIQELQKLVNPDVILLDDAFQHRKVKADYYILLTKYDDLYSDDFILPTGNLRESKRGAKRADVIVVTKCPKNLSEASQKKIIKKLKPIQSQQVFFSAIHYHKELGGKRVISLNELNEYEIILITGIANPMPLLAFLDEKGCKVHHQNFSDHHHFTSFEIKKIQAKFEKLKSKKRLLLTTEKDYMRLSNRMDGLHYLEIESQFLNDQQDLNEKIFKSLKSN